MPEPLTILYQDEWLIAVDKPAGHLVHPAELPEPDDLVTMKILREQIGQKVHVIHRLDRPTCGVLMFGLETEAARNLHQAFENQQVEKAYWALVDGHPKEDHWSCREALKKNESAPERRAETEFQVLERFNNGLSLIEAAPLTGRFHQIRKHLLQAGTAIVGDYRYADSARCDYLGSQLGSGTRMLLQAKCLKLTHPHTGGALTIEAETDSVIEEAIKRSRTA